VFVLAAPYVCTLQLEMLVENLQKGVFASPSMAYILVWLTVSGGNSIIPSWLFRFFPEMLTFLEILKGRHCLKEYCQFCKKNSPQKYLTNYFGHSNFRPVPASLKTGKSLQGEIVLVQRELEFLPYELVYSKGGITHDKKEKTLYRRTKSDHSQTAPCRSNCCI
jgi:hypothetical protein